jgi:protein-disulfide isomerase
VSALKACLAAPATDARLRADIEAGLRAGLKATPSFLVGGHLYAGALPADVLPARAAASNP